MTISAVVDFKCKGYESDKKYIKPGTILSVRTVYTYDEPLNLHNVVVVSQLRKDDSFLAFCPDGETRTFYSDDARWVQLGMLCENAHNVQDFDGSWTDLPCGNIATIVASYTYENEDPNSDLYGQMSADVVYLCASCRKDMQYEGDEDEHSTTKWVEDRELDKSVIQDIVREATKSHITGQLDITPKPVRSNKHAIQDQTNCWCESSACEGKHPMGNCPASVDESSPSMVYVGRVCEACATRIEDNDGQQYITR